MDKKQKFDWTSIEHKIKKVSFDLFRFWTKAYGINDTLIIKTEQHLIVDLKDVITSAINSLNNNEDLSDKPIGWDIGFVIGFIDGNLRKRWYHEYIAKNSEEYKTYCGLRAIEAYLEYNITSELKINELYKILFEENSNILYHNSEARALDLDVKKIEIVNSSESGKILTILRNLVIKQIKIIVESEDHFQLPVQDYFTIAELKQLIEDNKDTAA